MLVHQRLITVSSVTNPNAKDAVRFTAARATPDLNCPPVAVNDTSLDHRERSLGQRQLFRQRHRSRRRPDHVLGTSAVYLAARTTLRSVRHSSGGYIWSLDNANLRRGRAQQRRDADSGDPVFGQRRHAASNTATLTITIHGVTDPD